LIDSGSERVAFEATRFSLGVAGIKPAAGTNVSVNVGVAIAGYCIDLSPANEAERQMIERQAKIVGGGAVIDATAEPVRGIGPGGRSRIERQNGTD
jgi:hypothetical protein